MLTLVPVVRRGTYLNHNETLMDLPRFGGHGVFRRLGLLMFS